MVISVACTQAEYHHIISTLQFSQYDFSVAMSYFSHSPKCMWACIGCSQSNTCGDRVLEIWWVKQHTFHAQSTPVGCETTNLIYCSFSHLNTHYLGDILHILHIL